MLFLIPSVLPHILAEYSSHVLAGLEDNADLPLEVGVVLVERYRVVAAIGKGSFSRVVQAFDLQLKVMVGIKVLKNEKDCFDQGLGEIRILALLAQSDPSGSQPVLKMLDYFYYKVVLHSKSSCIRTGCTCMQWWTLCQATSYTFPSPSFTSLYSWCPQEHLLIVTELLRDSLFNFYRYLLASDTPGGIATYFTMPTLQKLSLEMLTALAYIHELGSWVVHVVN